jgi:hypothetical protein
MIKLNLSDEAVEEVARSGPEVALAKGVLVQAKQDLRRFRRAQDGIGREIYTGAHSWVVSNDLWWPYSFLNVCAVLGLSPDTLRTELLPGVQSGWGPHSRQIAQRISASVRGTLANVFGTRNSVASPRDSNRPVIAH